MRTPLLMCAFGVTCAACWSLLTDVPDVTGGVPDAAGGVASDADIVGGDATPADAGAGDAALEAATDGSTPTYCSALMPAPFFCDDFDVGTLGQRWSSNEITGGTLVLDAGTLVAASDCQGPLPTLQLEHVVAKGTASAHLTFTMKATFPPSSAFRIVGLHVKPTATTDYRLDLVWDLDHLAVFEDRGGTLSKGPGLTGFDIKSKSRTYELAIELANNTAVLFVDSLQHINKGLAAPATMTSFSEVDLGLAATACPGTIQLVYDDFVYQRQDP